MGTDQLIAKMRARVEQCRRLSQSIADEHASAALRQMADEGEADIERLLAEGGLDAFPSPQPEAMRSTGPTHRPNGNRVA